MGYPFDNQPIFHHEQEVTELDNSWEISCASQSKIEDPRPDLSGGRLGLPALKTIVTVWLLYIAGIANLTIGCCGNLTVTLEWLAVVKPVSRSCLKK